MNVGIIGAGPGGIALGILLARAGFREPHVRLGTEIRSASWDEHLRRWQLATAAESGVTSGATGAHAHLGMAVPRFPNLYMLYGPNTNAGSNSVIFVLEAQARYVVRALR